MSPVLVDENFNHRTLRGLCAAGGRRSSADYWQH
jgi:hypothetical protein